MKTKKEYKLVGLVVLNQKGYRYKPTPQDPANSWILPKILKIVRNGDSAVIMKTKRDVYVLKKHPTQNSYYGTCNGIKVQVSLSPMGGKIRFWS